MQQRLWPVVEVVSLGVEEEGRSKEPEDQEEQEEQEKQEREGGG
jgi:hypothetical protein